MKIKKKLLFLIVLYILLSTLTSQAANNLSIELEDSEYMIKSDEERIFIYYINEVYLENNLYSISNLLDSEFLSPEDTNRDEDLFMTAKKTTFVNSGNISIGYIDFGHNEASISRDMIKILDSYSNNYNDLKPEKEYDVKLKTLTQSVNGVFMGTKVIENEKSNFNLDLIFNFLVGRKLKTRDYSGIIRYDQEELIMKGKNKGIYSAVGQQMERNNKFKSYGYSLGGQFYWRIGEDKSVKFTVKNLLNQLIWKDVYTMEGEYDSDNVKVNEEGYLEYVSSFTGRYYFRDYITRLPIEYNLEYKHSAFTAGLYYNFKYYPYVYYNIYEGKFMAEPLQINVGILRDKYGLSLSHPLIDLELMTNNINIYKATSIKGKIGLKYLF
ncbi:MAG: hypothetical protein ACOCRL_00675 [Bacillota bacterium]